MPWWSGGYDNGTEVPAPDATESTIRVPVTDKVLKHGALECVPQPGSDRCN